MASTNVNSLFSVKGRVALVTGGTSGIGLMIAKVCISLSLSIFPGSIKLLANPTKGLVTNGARVYVCGLESDALSDIVASLNELGAESGGWAVGYVPTFSICRLLGTQPMANSRQYETVRID